MSHGIKVPGMQAVFFLTDLPDDREGLEVEEGAWVEVPMNVFLWPPGARTPESILCRSKNDPIHYKLFRYRDEIEGDKWGETGLNFGGTFSKSSWEDFASKLDAIRAVQAIAE